MTPMEIQPSNASGGRVDRLLDNIPIVGRLRREKRDEEEFQRLFKETVDKVRQDIQDGGFVQEAWWEEGDYREHYWVALGGDEKRYAVSLNIEFAENSSRVERFWLDLGDLVVSGKRRDFSFSASGMDGSEEEFFSANWTGAYMLMTRRVDMDNSLKEEKLGREEGADFLREILAARVDNKFTQTKYEARKKKESPDWLVFWVRDREEEHFLIGSEDFSE